MASHHLRLHKDEVLIPCDLIVVAIGQGIETRYFEGAWRYSQESEQLRHLIQVRLKNVKEYVAGGDCVTGPATVIRAIAAGKVAAANIDEYLLPSRDNFRCRDTLCRI